MSVLSTAPERVAVDPLDAPERFAAYLAHELRTPLATQRAMLELALTDPDADAESWRAIGMDLLRACEQQGRLLDACLALARSRDGLQRCETVDLAAIAAATLRDQSPCGLGWAAVLQPAWTKGDPGLLGCLLANLVSNAVRHNIAGGRFEVTTRLQGGRALLSVVNTGPRIPPGELPRLFRPFERFDPKPRSFGDGVGLGLAIVREIANAHHATLSARPGREGGLRVEVGFAAARR